MADMTFNTTEGSVVERKLLILYLNTGTSTEPIWSVIGRRVEDSSMEYDWSEETKQDILGVTRTTLQRPKITQSFDPCELDSGDKAQMKIWNQSIKDQDVGAMANNDLLLVHAYTGTSTEGAFAERYPASAVRPTGLGGSANVGMPIDVTFGGERETGTAKMTDGALAFTKDA